MIIDNHFIPTPPHVKVFVTVYSLQCLLCTGAREQYQRRVKESAEILQMPVPIGCFMVVSYSKAFKKNRHVWSKVCCCEPTRSGLVWSVLVPESSLVHATVLHCLVAK